MIDIGMLDETRKQVHVKPDPVSGLWMVLELTELESYFDDLSYYGEEVAQYNAQVMIESRGLSTYRVIEVNRD